MARSRPDDEFEDDARPQRRNRDDDDEEEDERPRRSNSSRRDRDDEDDDRRNPSKKGLSILGVLSLIQGIIALLVSFIPCIGAFAIIGGVIGLLLGGIGLIVAGKANHGKGLPLAGTIVSIISMIIAGIWILFIAGASTLPTLNTSTSSTPTLNSDIGGKPPITGGTVKVEFAKLLADYADDEDKADAKYKGKTVEVSGVMTAVDSADKKAVVVKMQSPAGGAKFVEIRLTPEASKGYAALKKGTYATFKGACAGLKDDEFVLLESAATAK